MKINSEDMSEKIQKSRPNLKANSIKQYETHLNKLKKLFDSDNFDFLSDPKKVMNKLEDKHYTSQRNTLNAVIILLMALNLDEKYNDLIDSYQKIRDGLNDKYLEDQQSGKISDKQKNNFAELSEIMSMIDTMKKEIVKQNLKNKETLTGKEKELLMVYTIFSFLVKYPLRNDLAGMKYISKTNYNKLTEDNKKENNYLVKNKNKLMMILNQYKTSKKYGEKIIELNPEISKVLRMYIKLTDKKVGEVLFTNSKGNPITRNGISQLLLKTSKKYLDKNISTTMMRKIVVSDKFADIKEEQKELADVMGHDVGTQNLVYVKEK
jgi:integrase